MPRKGLFVDNALAQHKKGFHRHFLMNLPSYHPWHSAFSLRTSVARLSKDVPFRGNERKSPFQKFS